MNRFLPFFLILFFCSNCLAEDFHALIENHQIAKIRTKISKRKFLVNLKDELGRSPLHLLAINGDLRLFTFFLNHGANQNAVDHLKGFTPLHYAVLHNRYKITRLLLARGAEVNARDHDGNSPLHFAAGNGNFSLVVELIRHNGDPDIFNQHLQTPLHFAAQAGKNNNLPFPSKDIDNYIRVARKLMEHGICRQLEDSWGDTPASVARKSFPELKKLNEFLSLYENLGYN